MEDIYTIVDKAIDVAFEEQKFHLKFYDFMKSCKTQEQERRSFNQSSTAQELIDFVNDLSEYIKGGKDGEHQILKERPMVILGSLMQGRLEITST